jgi:hypothetical protein
MPEIINPEEGNGSPAENTPGSEAEREQVTEEAENAAAKAKAVGEDGDAAATAVEIDERLKPNSVFVKTLADSAKGLGLSDAEVGKLTDGLNETLKNISDKIDKDTSYEDALEKVQNKFAKDVASVITDPDSAAAVEKFNQKNTDELYNGLKKASPEAAKAFLDKLNKTFGGKIEKLPDKMKDFNDQLNKITGDMAKEYPKLKKMFEDSQEAGDAKDARAGKTPRARMTFDQWMKVLGLLLTLGGIAGGMWAWLEYCKNHSGCMKVHNPGGNNPQTSEKVFCSGTSTGYLVQKCKCLSPSAPSPPSTTCDESSCNDSTTDTPTPEMCNSTKCENWEDLSKTPYLYYAYKVMGPIDGALDIGSRVVDLGTGAFGKIMGIILNVLKVVGLMILGLGVLYLIFIITKAVIKHVKNKKNSTSST